MNNIQVEETILDILIKYNISLRVRKGHPGHTTNGVEGVFGSTREWIGSDKREIDGWYEKQKRIVLLRLLSKIKEIEENE